MRKKRISSILLSKMTSIPLSQILNLKKKMMKILFSPQKIELKGLSIGRSKDNFTAYFIIFLILEYSHKKWCVSSTNFRNFILVLC